MLTLKGCWCRSSGQFPDVLACMQPRYCRGMSRAICSWLEAAACPDTFQSDVATGRHLVVDGRFVLCARFGISNLQDVLARSSFGEATGP
jgi:hypothetical protein